MCEDYTSQGRIYSAVQMSFLQHKEGQVVVTNEKLGVQGFYPIVMFNCTVGRYSLTTVFLVLFPLSGHAAIVKT